MDTYETLTRLNNILKIFTLHNISLKNVLTTAPWPYLKMAFILICFGLMYLYNMYYHFFIEALSDVHQSVKITDTLSTIFGYLHYMIDLYFVYKYGGESCIAYYETYDDIDKYFEMKYHREIKRKVLSSVVVFLVLWLVASLSDYTAWCLIFGWESPTTYIVAYFTFLIRLLTILELNAHSMHIGYRLKTIADVVRDHFSLAEDLPSRIKVAKVVDVKSVIRVVPLNTRDTYDVTRLGSYYLLLNQQATFLNNFFGVRILLHFLFTLSQMITFVNVIARVFAGSMFTIYYSGCYPAVTSFLRLALCAAVLTSMVYRCEQSARQTGHVISTLDHALVNKKTSPEIYSSLQQLRGLVTSRPIRFHAANFFSLDSTLLLSTASVVATYAVILLQATL